MILVRGNSLHGPRENNTSLYGPDKIKLSCIAFILFSIPYMTFPSPSVTKFCQHQTELSPAVRPLCFAANATENASHPRGSRLRRSRAAASADAARYAGAAADAARYAARLPSD